jgi:hypothetical protein
MPLKLIAPVYKTFSLDRSDEKYGTDGEPTMITVKQATQAEHEQRQQLFATLERKFRETEPDEVSLVQTVSMEELKRLEAWLTLVECNINDEKGKDLFPSVKGKNGIPRLKMTRQQFNQAWGKLPPDVAAEIVDNVLEVNIIWAGKEGEES